MKGKKENKKIEEKQRDDQRVRDAYIKKVKKALNAARNEANKKEELSEYKLLAEIRKAYGFKLARQTLRNLFDEKSNSLDYACLVTVCRFYGFDFNKILSPEPINGAEEKFRTCAAPRYRVLDDQNNKGINNEIYAGELFAKSTREVKDKFLVLTDDSYFGTFYGYTASEDSTKTTPNEFTLKIERDANTDVSSATLRTTMSYEDSGKVNDVVESYHGIPVFVTSYRVIILFLVKDNTGEFRQMSFSYKEHENGMGLIFRHGIMLTGERLNGETLCAQSFVLFNKQIQEDKYQYLLGLLKTPNHTFSVPIDEAMELAKTDVDVADFLEQFSGALNRHRKEVYMINEDNILHDKASNMMKDNIVKALLRLKQKARLQNVYHYRAAKYRFENFAVSELAGVKFEVDKVNKQGS
ncbi:MAG: hypothetical protein IJW63_05455 [Lachnospiraceae bacterium]|nr:hypothetical protein [Lachnospiraceae bacterium]